MFLDFSSLEKITQADIPLFNQARQLDCTKNMEVLDKPIALVVNDMKGCPIDGNGGRYEGERGDSPWIPDDDDVPTRYNPDKLTWGEIKDKYGFDKIPFHEGEPDFSEIAKGQVEIDDFSDNRRKNFMQADEALALKRGCTPEEVKKWREENGYTWHECKDCKTMQKVPSEVHANISHTGGISECKRNNT